MDYQNCLKQVCELAAFHIYHADALLISAGAGMGVDSGLPDYRGNQGFWKAYPALKGRPYFDLVTPNWFKNDPKEAWGFYGYRMKLFRETTPHKGYEILKKWANKKEHFVFTSNVDGQFLKTGFEEEKILECHGSIHYLQCLDNCTDEVWKTGELDVVVNDNLEAVSGIPKCKNCSAMARPNVLMFKDSKYLTTRSSNAYSRYGKWLAHDRRGKNTVAIECGAGKTIPTVRYNSQTKSDKIIRINPRDPEVPEGHLGIPLGALEALEYIDYYLSRI